MTYDEAVRALGFEPGDSMENHMPVLREAEVKLAELVEASDDLVKRADYAHQLKMLREAIAVVEIGPETGPVTEESESVAEQSDLEKETSTLKKETEVTPVAEEKKPETTPGAEEPEVTATVLNEPKSREKATVGVEKDESPVEKQAEEAKKNSGPGRLVATFVILGLLGAAAWFGVPALQQAKEEMNEDKVVALLAEGRLALEKRKWPEAEERFNLVLESRPESVEAKQGLLDAKEGREEAQRQQIAYLTGTVQSSIESRDWDEVEKALNELEGLEPGHELVEPTRKRIEEGRVFDQIAGLVEQSEEAIQEERWDDLTTHYAALEVLAPNHVDLPRYRQLAEEGLKLMEERRERAKGLYEEALALDEGVYSGEALETIREAMRLDRQPEYQALYDKLAGYQRVMKVPEEFPTITAALEAARPKDSIRVAEGTYEESLVFEYPVALEGAGPEKTIIKCAAEKASVITVKPGVKEGRLSGVTLQQSGFVLAPERFPIVAVEQGEITMEDCVLEKGSGHGIAVLDGGSARILDVRVSQCGWDGLAVHGEGSHAEVDSSRFVGNIHHGVDAWNGGTVTLRKTRSSGNGLTGVVLMSGGKSFLVEQCTLDANRELGIMVSKGASADLISNQVTQNLLGGVNVQGEGSKAKLRGNVITRNEKIGVMIDEKSTLAVYDQNVVKDNNGKQEELSMKIVSRVEEVSPEPLKVEATEVR